MAKKKAQYVTVVPLRTATRIIPAGEEIAVSDLGRDKEESAATLVDLGHLRPLNQEEENGKVSSK